MSCLVGGYPLRNFKKYPSSSFQLILKPINPYMVYHGIERTSNENYQVSLDQKMDLETTVLFLCNLTYSRVLYNNN